MIVAIILAGETGAEAETYFKSDGGESTLERVAGTVLRGPFGGTLVAAAPEIVGKVREVLSGFAVQFVDAPKVSAGKHAMMAEALKAAAAFRARWERAMELAAGRFSKPDSKKEDGGAEWSRHKQNPDVKIRGLARSFERDGVLVVPGGAARISKELLARVVEEFARDRQNADAKMFAQAIHAGERGWPVAMSLEAARIVADLPAATDFSAWLLENIESVRDVKA